MSGLARLRRETAVEFAGEITGAAGKTEVHVDLRCVRIARERLQDHRLAGHARGDFCDPHHLRQRCIDGARGGLFVAKRRGKPEHAIVGSDQHKIRRIVPQLVAMAREPRLRLLVFRNAELQQKAEADRSTDDRIGELLEVENTDAVANGVGQLV